MPMPQTGSALQSGVLARVLNLVDCGIIVLDAQACIVVWNGWLVPRRRARPGQSVDGSVPDPARLARRSGCAGGAA
jgi:hypothetical protein